MAEMIQANLLDIGVNSQIISHDQATYFGTLMDAANLKSLFLHHRLPVCWQWISWPCIMTFIPLGWSGPERDYYGELSMGAISTYDPAERGEQLYEAIKVFVDHTPWYGLCEVVSARAEAPELDGVEYMIAGSIYYQDMYFDEK